MLTDDEAKRRIAANVARHMARMKPPMCQAELARVTGDSEMRVSQMIRAVNVPGSGFLARLAAALRVTTNDLLAVPRQLTRRA